MNFFNLFKFKDINSGIIECINNNGKLIDVREVYEYKSGHVFNSINLPLSQIEHGQIDKNLLKTNLYVYCQSGVRSAKAKKLLEKNGAISVSDIGGVFGYKGELVV